MDRGWSPEGPNESDELLRSWKVLVERYECSYLPAEPLRPKSEILSKSHLCFFVFIHQHLVSPLSVLIISELWLRFGQVMWATFNQTLSNDKYRIKSTVSWMLKLAPELIPNLAAPKDRNKHRKQPGASSLTGCCQREISVTRIHKHPERRRTRRETEEVTALCLLDVSISFSLLAQKRLRRKMF